jgi:hypothetical protein
VIIADLIADRFLLNPRRVGLGFQVAKQSVELAGGSIRKVIRVLKLFFVDVSPIPSEVQL